MSTLAIQYYQGRRDEGNVSEAHSIAQFKELRQSVLSLARLRASDISKPDICFVDDGQ